MANKKGKPYTIKSGKNAVKINSDKMFCWVCMKETKHKFFSCTKCGK